MRKYLFLYYKDSLKYLDEDEIEELENITEENILKYTIIIALTVNNN